MYIVIECWSPYILYIYTFVYSLYAIFLTLLIPMYLLLYITFSFQILYCLYRPRIYCIFWILTHAHSNISTLDCSLDSVISRFFVKFSLNCICKTFYCTSELVNQAFCCTCCTTCKSVYATNKLRFEVLDKSVC
jgi:hypothetical protein